jgi:Flp pilus assembly pilin Flp
VSVLSAPVRGTLSRITRAQDGQGLAEYALIISLIAIIAIVALAALGGNVTTLLSATGQSV